MRAPRRALWRLALFAGLLIFFTAGGHVEHAHAAVSCPNLNVDINSVSETGIANLDTAQCIIPALLVNNGFVFIGNALVHSVLFLGFEGGLGEPPTSIACPGGTVDPVQGSIALPADGACNFTVTFDISGTTVEATGTLTRAATNVISLTNMVVTGGLFDNPPALNPLCPTASDKSRITDHLLSTFNQVGGSVFGSGGIPEQVLNNRGGGGTGFSMVPNSGVQNALSALPFASGGSFQGTGPMDGQLGLASEPRGIEALGQQSSDQGFNFSFDLQQLLSNQRNKEALGVHGFENGRGQSGSRWNAFALGRYVDFDDGATDADRDGHLWWITSGLTYALSERTTIGAFARVRQGEVDSAALDASLDSSFFGGGIFLATRFQNGVRIMGAGLIETSDNDIAIAGASGSFNTDQWTLEARVDKRFIHGRHWIEPSLKVFYTDMQRDAYTDSSATLVPEGGTTLGRITFGPTVGTTVYSGTTAINPFARINGAWNFANNDDFALSTGAVLSDADLALDLGGGFDVVFKSGVILTAAADWFSFDSDLQGIVLTGSIGMPAAALGLGNVAPAGLLSVDFAGNAQDTLAKARLKIPLGEIAD